VIDNCKPQVEEVNETKLQQAEVEAQKEEALNARRAVQPKLEEWKGKKAEIAKSNESLQKQIEELTELHDHFQEKVDQLETVRKQFKLKS